MASFPMTIEQTAYDFSSSNKLQDGITAVVMANYLNYQSGNGNRAKILLLWTKRRQPISRLSVNVLREVCSYLHRKSRIIGLLNLKATIFDVEERTFQSATLSMAIPLSCVFSELTEESILIFGFENKSAYSLNFPDLKFTRLANMHEDRGFSGSIRCGPFVYAFGGFIKEKITLSSSERYNVSTGKWQSLPSMLHPKRSFSPVLHKQIIYLPAFLGPNLVELFDTKSLTFAIYCKLPTVNQMSVAVAVGFEMVIMAVGRADKVSLRKKMRPRKVSRFNVYFGASRTRSTPLVVGREVWFMLVDELKAVRYHLDTRQVQMFNEDIST